MMMFPLTNRTMRKKGAKVKGEMLGESKGRKETRGKESTEQEKRRRNYRVSLRKQKGAGGGEQRDRWKKGKRKERGMRMGKT